MKTFWLLILFVTDGYYEQIHVSPNMSLSAEPPTAISLSFVYDTEQQCKAALDAARKYFPIRKEMARCKQVEEVVEPQGETK